jgi:structural maintenance of chromosome 4
MVVETVEAGQSCIEYLRKNNLGRANFIVLDKLPARDPPTGTTPEECPRLYNLVRPLQGKFAPAFYSVLGETIVARDLAQANRVAYGPKRWRVVTLEGGVIDKSGTMTGGGTRVSRGGMSDKAVGGTSTETVAKLEKERDNLEGEYAAMRKLQGELERRVGEVESRGPEVEMLVSKLSLEITALGKSAEDTQRQLTELKYRPLMRY